MKRLIPGIVFCASLQFISIGCNNNSKDATTTADSTNTSQKTMGIDSSKMESEHSMTTSKNEFVNKAAMGGMMEVALGKLAQTNARSKEVKEFGKLLEKDHSKANDELKSITASKNITLPSSLNADQANHLKEMSTKKDDAFDKAYIDMMVEDHVEDIEEFKKAAASNPDPDIKNFATKILPVIQNHLLIAKNLKAKM